MHKSKLPSPVHKKSLGAVQASGAVTGVATCIVSASWILEQFVLGRTMKGVCYLWEVGDCVVLPSPCFLLNGSVWTGMYHYILEQFVLGRTMKGVGYLWEVGDCVILPSPCFLLNGSVWSGMYHYILEQFVLGRTMKGVCYLWEVGDCVVLPSPCFLLNGSVWTGMYHYKQSAKVKNTYIVQRRKIM
ncbi:hypothetical protein J6590_072532 [Homalodisca vitripennis]|nr:hypothetical protein J6590_072532 [Homalodisca vitripennis]